MAFRFCLAFCLLAAGAASMLRSVGEARLRGRLASDSWVARANAAMLLSDDARAVPWLIVAAGDEAPAVRQNARWALRRLTGMAWASAPEACTAWVQAMGTAEPPPPHLRSGSGPAGRPLGEWLEFSLSVEDGAIRVTVRNATPRDIELRAGRAENYTCFLYDRHGSPVRLIDAPEPEPGLVETWLFAADGGSVGRWRWSLDALRLAGQGGDSEFYDLPGLPSGSYVVESRAGALTGIQASPDPGNQPPLAASWPLERRVALLRR